MVARNITLSNDGKHAYVTGYNDDAVSWYRKKREHWCVETYGGILKDGIGGVDGLDGSWAVKLSSDGKSRLCNGQ